MTIITHENKHYVPVEEYNVLATERNEQAARIELLEHQLARAEAMLGRMRQWGWRVVSEFVDTDLVDDRPELIDSQAQVIKTWEELSALPIETNFLEQAINRAKAPLEARLTRLSKPHDVNEDSQK